MMKSTTIALVIALATFSAPAALDYRSPLEFELGHATPTVTVWPPRWGFQGMGKSTAMSKG
jgi:hypothetical protein